MVISVASGKGGTGKTTVATSLALSANSAVQLLDCDVEEPNAHIFLKPDIAETRIVATPVPRIDPCKCDLCGRCAEVCAFNALAVLPSEVLVFPHLCHGCGGCTLLCPLEAITEVGRRIGVVEIGISGRLRFVQGILDTGEAISPPLIRAVKQYADATRTVVIDAPPGTSCPAIEAVKGSDFCVLVTEPTPFGLSDLKLIVEVLMKLAIPFGVVVNRSGVGGSKLDDYCRTKNIAILMRIPFRRQIAVAYSEGIPLVEAFPEYQKAFAALVAAIRGRTD